MPKMSDKFLRTNEVTALACIGRSTLYELIARGDFPQPIKLSSRRVVFSETEVRGWLKQRAARRKRIVPRDARPLGARP
jgi:prophage regulatory protein